MSKIKAQIEKVKKEVKSRKIKHDGLVKKVKTSKLAANKCRNDISKETAKLHKHHGHVPGDHKIKGKALRHSKEHVKNLQNHLKAKKQNQKKMKKKKKNIKKKKKKKKKKS